MLSRDREGRSLQRAARDHDGNRALEASRHLDDLGMKAAGLGPRGFEPDHQ